MTARTAGSAAGSRPAAGALSPSTAGPARPLTALDRGAATLEYVASLVVASLLVVAVALAITSSRPDSAVARAICSVLTLGQGDCGGGLSLADKVPTQPCVVGSNSSTLTLRAGIAVIGQGSERWLIEELGDGRYRLTRGTAAAGGGAVGAGFELTGTWNDQDYGFSLGADANALGQFETGEVYYADSEQQARQFLGERRVSSVLDSTVGPGGPVRGLFDKVRGGNRLPEADETWVAAGVIGDAKATVDWIAAGAQAEVKGSTMVGVRLRKDGSSTAYYTGSFSGQAAASFWASDGPDADTTLFKAQTAGTVGASVEVDFDADHLPVTVRLKTTVGGSAAAGKRVAFEDEQSGPDPNAYVDRTIEIPLNTPQARLAAARALTLAGAVAVPGLPVVQPGALDAEDSAAVFAAAVRQGRMWEDSYDLNQNTDAGFAVNAAWIAKVGVEGSKVSVTRDSRGSRYFDGIGWQDREGCGA